MVSYSAYNRPAPTTNQLAQPARNLPIHYAILIAAFNVVVHWMASRAVFVTSVQVLTYPPDRMVTADCILMRGLVLLRLFLR
jgi:hypothetical protein